MRILACICLAKTNSKVRTKSFVFGCFWSAVLTSSVSCFIVSYKDVWGLLACFKKVLCVLFCFLYVLICVVRKGRRRNFLGVDLGWNYINVCFGICVCVWCL